MRKSSLYVKDIIDAIEKIEEFVGNMSFDEFVRDDKTTSAVVRKLEIIGEATKQLPSDVRMRFQDIPWQAMAKTCDKIIHFYHGVDFEVVWKIIKEDLPPLKPILKKIYNLLLEEEK
ncbi:MAG: DUF86 domain-containing protein [Caldisericum exile]|uniref:HepT-like ribonuclease domain-containing protein n=1 Tax=Caldisericum exile TaxID=693075 RepID=UPI003C7772C0